MSLSVGLWLCVHQGSSCWAPSLLFWCLFTPMLTPQVQNGFEAGELRHQSALRHQCWFSTFISCYGVVSNEIRFCALYFRQVQVDLPWLKADLCHVSTAKGMVKPRYQAQLRGRAQISEFGALWCFWSVDNVSRASSHLPRSVLASTLLFR